jgi:propanol-preferring alcohol dehydrogenase
VNGGYAEFMATRESSAFPVPDVFSDQAAVPLLCGGVIGYRALRFAQVRPGERLGLFGFGNSAHVVLQIAAKRGVKPYVFTRGKRHRELAADLGAVWVGGPDDAPPADTHASIIFAPAGDLVPKALARLERGGRLVLAGITMSQIPAMDYSLVYQERSIMSVANTTRRDAMELLDASAAVPIEPVVESFPLDQANQVLTMMKTGYLKAGACLVP